MVEHAPARILVVDDDAAIRVTLDALLHHQGYAVATAANGEEALAWLMQSSFDLLLIDPQLPGISAREVAQCAQQCQPAARIVALAESGDCNGIPITDQVGQFEYMLKSDNSQEVVELVAAVLDHQHVLNWQLDRRAH